MLPQIMPMPWLATFFAIYYTLISLRLQFSTLKMVKMKESKKSSPLFSNLPW